MRLIDREEVACRLDYPQAIELVRGAMIALSRGDTLQLPRGILPLAEQKLYGVMTGALGTSKAFGSKLISVFRGNAAGAVPSHQGMIVVFDPETGAPAGIVDAGEVTAIRTAAASAVATDALARTDAGRLLILGTGEQAFSHARAIACIRAVVSIDIWGRRPARSAQLAAEIERQLGIETRPVENLEEAVAVADIICTVTAAVEPVLRGAWLRPGVHLNIVGSSHVGPVEIDNDAVARSRFVADSRPNVLAQGAEFLRAREAGIVGDEHIVAEIGEILLGRAEGRRSAIEVTAYKSLGHVVQDIACAAALVRQH